MDQPPRRESDDDELESEVDYRFTLANERTFLAWNRTALALIAGGLAVMQFLPDIHPVWLRRTLSLLLVLCGGAVAGTSVLRWQSTQRAMVRGDPLPASKAPRLLALGVLAGTVLVAILILTASGQG